MSYNPLAMSVLGGPREIKFRAAMVVCGPVVWDPVSERRAFVHQDEDSEGAINCMA